MPMAENVIAAAQAVGATHMLPGNVYNFGYDITVGTEGGRRRRSPRPRRPKSASPWKRCSASRLKTHGVQTIVLRAGDFYGGASRRAGST